MRGNLNKNWTLGALLTGLAVMAPLVAYAGVTIVYPTSVNTANVDTTPIITFASGSDYTMAGNATFAASFTQTENNAAYTLTVSGLSGGNLTVDKLLNVTMNSVVTSYKVTVTASDASGGLSAAEITTLKLRFWTGSTAPTADGDSGVCAVINLEDAAGTESTNSCTADTDVQLSYILAAGATGSATFTIRPSSIVLD